MNFDRYSRLVEEEQEEESLFDPTVLAVGKRHPSKDGSDGCRQDFMAFLRSCH